MPSTVCSMSSCLGSGPWRARNASSKASAITSSELRASSGRCGPSARTASRFLVTSANKRSAMYDIGVWRRSRRRCHFIDPPFLPRQQASDGAPIWSVGWTAPLASRRHRAAAHTTAPYRRQASPLEVVRDEAESSLQELACELVVPGIPSHAAQLAGSPRSGRPVPARGSPTGSRIAAGDREAAWPLARPGVFGQPSWCAGEQIPSGDRLDTISERGPGSGAEPRFRFSCPGQDRSTHPSSGRRSSRGHLLRDCPGVRRAEGRRAWRLVWNRHCLVGRGRQLDGLAGVRWPSRRPRWLPP